MTGDVAKAILKSITGTVAIPGWGTRFQNRMLKRRKSSYQFVVIEMSVDGLDT